MNCPPIAFVQVPVSPTGSVNVPLTNGPLLGSQTNYAMDPPHFAQGNMGALNFAARCFSPEKSSGCSLTREGGGGGGTALRGNATADGAKTSRARALTGATPTPGRPVVENHGHPCPFSPPRLHGGQQWGGWVRAMLQPILVRVKVPQTRHHHLLLPLPMLACTESVWGNAK